MSDLYADPNYFPSNTNRVNQYKFSLSGIDLTFKIFYNKFNPEIQFLFQNSIEDNLKKGIYLRTYKNLEKSQFCNMYFKLQSSKNEHHDFKNKFDSFTSSGLNNTVKFFSEKYIFDMRDFHIEKKMGENSLQMFGCTFKKNKTRSNTDCENEYMIFFFQRRCRINKRSGKFYKTPIDIIRTSALQISNIEGLNILTKEIKSYNNFNPTNRLQITEDLCPLTAEDLL